MEKWSRLRAGEVRKAPPDYIGRTIETGSQSLSAVPSWMLLQLPELRRDAFANNWEIKP